MNSNRHYSFIDKALMTCNQGLQILFAKPIAKQVSPAKAVPEANLSATETKHSAGLMRVDHTGEVCAQALYLGQAWVAKDADLKAKLLSAADEEGDHLAWCNERLAELDSRPSYLNLFWYLASFKLGLLAGLAGDAWSLGFVVETERQVTQHLDEHLQSLANQDGKSRAILQQMRADELAHAVHAQALGGKELPAVIKCLMRLQSKVMTKTAYYL